MGTGEMIAMCLGLALLGGLGLAQELKKTGRSEPGTRFCLLFSCAGSLGAAAGFMIMRLLGWHGEMVSILFLVVGFFGGGFGAGMFGDKFFPGFDSW